MATRRTTQDVSKNAAVPRPQRTRGAAIAREGRAVLSPPPKRRVESIDDAWRQSAVRKEIGSLLAVAAAVLVLLSLLSYRPSDLMPGMRWPEGTVGNWIGPLGAVLAAGTVRALGICAFALPPLLGLSAVILHQRRNRTLRRGELLALGGVAVSLCLLVHLAWPAVPFRGAELQGGGFVGGLLARGAVRLVSPVGAWILGVTALLISARLAFGVQVHIVLRALGVGAGRVVRPAGSALQGALVAGGAGAAGVVGRAWRRLWDAPSPSAEEGEEAGTIEEFAVDPPEEPPRARVVRGREPDDPAETVPPDRPGARVPPAEPPQPMTSRAVSVVALAEVIEDADTALLREEPSLPAAVRPRIHHLAPAARDLSPSLDGEQSTREEPMPPPSAPLPPDPLPTPGSGRNLDGAASRGEVHAEVRVRSVSGTSAPARTQMKPAPPASPPAARAAPLVAPFLSPFETGGSDDDLDDDAPLPGVPAISKPVPVPASLAGPRIRPPPTPASATAREIVESREPRRLLLPTIVPFELPGLGLLENPSPGTRVVDESELRRQAARLEECLRHYAVEGRVTDILPGPVVTMFEFEPAPGIKVARIANLENDLALALRAVKVRIVAPIPGKGAVGIEVPSAARETVYLREIMGSAAFRRPGLRLPLALGKAIDGTAVSADMAKMPHLLVAGTTGSGKSVCVNSIILSLVYARRPDEVRLILVDPKMLEFSIYDGIPHLLVPVVTSPKKAAMALRWAVEEMGRRYRVLAAMNTRNIVNYNEKAEKLQAEWLAWDASCRAGKPIDKPDCGRAAGEDTIVYRSEGGDPVGPPDKMPYIVIIIDELADLMMVARKEVEESIVRLAQMARAAGLHLLLATQRPSVDVITGLIKANFPTRLSFQVRSKIDSRTVLDANGAENLLGMGDGLYLPAGASDPVRVHGAFVNDDEVKRVVDHLKDQGEPEYVDQVLAATEGEEDEDGESADGEEDDMYDQALAVVAEAGKASTSLLQRRLKLGYNRAARIIDTMEKRGVVGPADGARPRDVYVKPYDT